MEDPQEALFAATEKIAQQGLSLVPRVVPDGSAFRQWAHYPEKDAISPSSRSRWYYHAHPPDQREDGEHGHFHLFLPLSMFEGIDPLIGPEAEPGKKTPAKVVHIAGLSFLVTGEPLSWFTTNFWVTREYLMPADAIVERLSRFDVRDAPGDPLVNIWLTAAVRAFETVLAELLRQRDSLLGPNDYKRKELEIVSSAAFEI